MLNKLWMYLYSNKNLAGCGLALIGLGLHLLGWLDQYWLLAIAALYLAGVLLMPGRKKVSWQFDANANEALLREALQSIREQIRGRVSVDIYKRIRAITDNIETVLPRLHDLPDRNSSFFTLRETTVRYLPDMLRDYLRLPKAYRVMHPVKNGHTAQEILAEQLDILDSEIRKIVEDIHTADVQSLQAHGDFLRDKFSEQDLFGLH